LSPKTIANTKKIARKIASNKNVHKYTKKKEEKKSMKTTGKQKGGTTTKK
jgi:hypothetical protein